MPKKKTNRFLDFAILTLVLLIGGAIAFNIFYFNYLNSLNKDGEVETSGIKEAQIKKVNKIESSIFTEKLLDDFSVYKVEKLPEYEVGNPKPFKVEEDNRGEEQ